MTVPGHGVAIPLVLALEHNRHCHHDHVDGDDLDNVHLTGGCAVSSMGSRWTGVVTESPSPAGQTAASSRLWVAEPS